MSDYWNNPPDQGRDPTAEEEAVQGLLELSDLTQSAVDAIMKVIASIVDRAINESEKECQVCRIRAEKEASTAEAAEVVKLPYWQERGFDSAEEWEEFRRWVAAGKPLNTAEAAEG